VISLGSLAAFDFLIWLRTGARAAELLRCNQSTVSREAKKCQKIFRVSLIKTSAEWSVIGDEFLLNAERHVHQRYRWESNLPLRLDGQHWLRESYSPLPLDGWIKGNMNYMEYRQPLYLLQNRIIDAWLCSSPDHPCNPDLTAIQLCSMPSYLVVKRSHPLVELGTSITLDDVRRYPRLPLPRQAFPAYESVLDSLGLNQENQSFVSTSLAPIEDLLVGIASPLTISQYGSDYVPLPIKIPVLVGDTLVIRTEFADHPRTDSLLGHLRSQLHSIACEMTDVEILDDALTPKTTSR